MEDNFKIQVSRDHYFDKYDSVERFISYFHQIDFALKTKTQKILEIGVGNMIVADYLKRRGLDVTTCDFDKELEPEYVADVRELPFEDGQFETVLAFEILEHIPFLDFEKALLELRRVARKNILISFPYSCAYLESIFVFSIPFFKKRITLPIRIPYFPFKVEINEKNKEHYWEMGRRGYSKRKIRSIIRKYFRIKKEFQPMLNSYHYFFILEKR